MKFQDRRSRNRGFGAQWRVLRPGSSLHGHWGCFPPSAPQTAAGEETAFWRVLVLSQSLLTAVCRPQRQELGGTFFHMGSGSLRVADVLAGRRVLGTSL